MKTDQVTTDPTTNGQVLAKNIGERRKKKGPIVRPDKFDRKLAAKVRENLIDWLNDAGKFLGVNVAMGAGTYRDNDIEFKIRVNILRPDGIPETVERLRWSKMCKAYELHADDLDALVTIGGEVVRLSGIDPKKKKYPIQVCAVGGETFRQVSVEKIVEALKKGRVQS